MAARASERRFFRAVIRQVHPDVFERDSEQQRTNSESLKLLHNVVERLASGKRSQRVSLRFYIRCENGSTTCEEKRVQVRDSLLPLYESFGVITPKEASKLRQSAKELDNSALSDVDFLQWLNETIQDASMTAAELSSRRHVLAELKRDMADEFELAEVVPALERPAGVTSVGDLRAESEAMASLQKALRKRPDVAANLQGLRVRVYAPSSAPVRDYHWFDEDELVYRHVETCYWADVRRDGSIEIVGGGHDIGDRLAALDLVNAQRMAALSRFWTTRRQALARCAAQSMGVKYVWKDEHLSDEAFCLWAGRVIRDPAVGDLLTARDFSFSVLVHADPQAPAATFLDTCGTLQVHHQCAPKQVVECLVSHASALAADESSKRIEDSAAERELLGRVKRALGAKHVVRICAGEHAGAVTRALQRLLEHADAIRSQIDLKDVCLAIDDNYHVWDSGYLSIPYDFDIETLPSRVGNLLTAGGGDVDVVPHAAVDVDGSTEGRPAAGDALDAHAPAVASGRSPDSQAQSRAGNGATGLLDGSGATSSPNTSPDHRAQGSSTAAAASEATTVNGKAVRDAMLGRGRGMAPLHVSPLPDADSLLHRETGHAAPATKHGSDSAGGMGPDLATWPAPTAGSAMSNTDDAPVSPRTLRSLMNRDALYAEARARFSGLAAGLQTARDDDAPAQERPSGPDAATSPKPCGAAHKRTGGGDAVRAKAPGFGVSRKKKGGKGKRGKGKAPAAPLSSSAEPQLRRADESDEMRAFQARLRSAIGASERGAWSCDAETDSFKVGVQELAATVQRARDLTSRRDTSAKKREPQLAGVAEAAWGAHAESCDDALSAASSSVAQLSAVPTIPRASIAPTAALPKRGAAAKAMSGADPICSSAALPSLLARRFVAPRIPSVRRMAPGRPGPAPRGVALAGL